ncbi:hypothetical protein [Prosthecobacter sp.]|uniref:hypothetical protein n=1 Tax=Prosthecobacter sp. TaxID=1965333 RepID=UPI003784DBA0
MKQALRTARHHGFRLSFVDALVLVTGAVLSGWLAKMDFPLWWIVPAAVGHFFLFCNVFLVWRRWELLWAAAFIFNVAGHFSLETYTATPVLLWQAPATILVIVFQMRSPWYHGIFARQINPRLADYLNDTL